MLRWITLARSRSAPVRIGIAVAAVMAATALQLVARFPGEPFLLYFVAVVGSTALLGRTAGFVAVAGTGIASALYRYGAVYPVTHAIDLSAIVTYGIIAAPCVEVLSRLVDSALTAPSAAAAARVHYQQLEDRPLETQLGGHDVGPGLTPGSEAHFRATFDKAAIGIAHVGPDGRYLRANEVLRDIFGYPAGELVTKSFRDLTHPDDLAAELARVELVRQGKAETYDSESRYLRKDGAIIWCKNTVGCVRRDNGSIEYFVGMIEDISARKRAEKQLRENEERFRSSLRHSPLPILLFDDREHILVVSESWLEQSGYLGEELERLEDWTIRARGECSDVLLEHIRRVMIVSTEPPEASSGELMISTKDGRKRLWRFVFSALPQRFDGQRLFICIAQDVTAQKAHEEQVHLLMREIDHRARNILSLVQVIARKTLTRDPEEFIERFTGRIQALAANQEELARNEWQGVGVEDLVPAELSEFRNLVGSRITMNGMPTLLNPAAAQAIGLAVHELAVNAGKFGALSTESGRVDVRWLAEDDVFTMNWTERDGPRVRAPEHKGFGSAVIDDMASRTLGAEVQLDYAPAGLGWRLTCPVANALARTARPMLK